MATESNHRYAILTETNGGEYETWYTFIRYEGNEEAIHNLDEQFKKIRFYIIDELSTFEIEYKRLVGEQTAREMCKMDLNSYMFHRKFDGKLSLIDFGFSKNDRNDDRIEKINDKIGMGDIDRYIDKEDPCDSDFESVSDSQSVRSDSESDSESDRGSDDERYYRERNGNGNGNDRNRRYSYSSDESEKKESPPRYKNEQKGLKSSNELKNGSKSSNDSKNDLKNDQKGSKNNSNNSNNSKNDQKGSKKSNDSKVNKDSKTKG